MADNERLQDFAEDKAKARFWHNQIEQASKHEQDWRKRAEAIVERYRDEQKRDGEWRYSMLWANTQLNFAALIGQIPMADVSRRWMSDNAVVRDGAEVMEKALRSAMDDRCMERSVRDAVLEASLPGRGVIRVRYNADMEEIEDEPAPEVGADGIPLIDETGQLVMTEATTEERKKSERVYFERVYWQDYRESPARAQEDVWWRAFRDTTMDRDGLIEEFGPEVGKKIPLQIKGVGGETTVAAHGVAENSNVPSAFSRAEVWEIWNKRTGKIITVAKGYDKIVREEDPPLQFEGFFDMADPLVLYDTTDNNIPLPEYTFYQDLALELDVLQGRLAKITSVLKIGGFYHAMLKNFPSLRDLNDGDFAPTDEKAMFALQDGNPGLDKLIASLPIEKWAAVIPILNDRVEVLRAAIFEITGFSDLLRGQTKASETLGAQNLKAQFGSFRLLPKQREVQVWLEQTYSLAGEVISEMFDADTLTKITGVGEEKPLLPFEEPEVPEDMPPEQAQFAMAQAAMQWEQQQLEEQEAEAAHFDEVVLFLRDQQMRAYRTNIELDELARPDRQAMQTMQAEAMAQTTQFMNALEGVPELMVPPLLAMYKAWARNFKLGKEVEELIDQAIEDYPAHAEQMQQQQAAAASEPSPDVQLKAETDMQIAQLKAQVDAQGKEMQAQVQMMLKGQDGAQQAPEGQESAIDLAALAKIAADRENLLTKEEGDTNRLLIKEGAAMERKMVDADVATRDQDIKADTAQEAKMMDISGQIAKEVMRPVNGSAAQ